MKNVQYTFRRVEKKYILSPWQHEQLVPLLSEHMMPDEYGQYTICNIYFDTDDYELIRTSIEKPVYKEKFRLRSYGVAGEGQAVFAEIKKKYKGIVYKRRIAAPWEDIIAFMNGGECLGENEYTMAEMREFFGRYRLEPKVFLAYEREAFVGKEEPDLRLTFDRNIRWRENSLDLTTSDEGEPIQEEDVVIMEIKGKNAMPLWLVHILSEYKIYPGSFSKYGTCYRNYIAKTILQ